mmetsp:Transcript_31767/g.77415  ORF Transcript_31767/g.77415 Transcript_31767/m.77415 type:complete len:394 (-) Transcript_31767:751-1932(-)
MSLPVEDVREQHLEQRHRRPRSLCPVPLSVVREWHWGREGLLRHRIPPEHVQQNGLGGPQRRVRRVRRAELAFPVALSLTGPCRGSEKARVCAGPHLVGQGEPLERDLREEPQRVVGVGVVGVVGAVAAAARGARGGRRALTGLGEGDLVHCLSDGGLPSEVLPQETPQGIQCGGHEVGRDRIEALGVLSHREAEDIHKGGPSLRSPLDSASAPEVALKVRDHRHHRHAGGDQTCLIPWPRVDNLRQKFERKHPHLRREPCSRRYDPEQGRAEVFLCRHAVVRTQQAVQHLERGVENAGLPLDMSRPGVVIYLPGGRPEEGDQPRNTAGLHEQRLVRRVPLDQHPQEVEDVDEDGAAHHVALLLCDAEDPVEDPVEGNNLLYGRVALNQPPDE